MQVIISGKHMEVGDALKTHIESLLQQNVKKYFDRAIKATVVISKHEHHFLADIQVNEGSGHQAIIKGNGVNEDPYSAANEAIVKIEKQLKRYKSKLNDHTAQRLEKMSEYEAKKYTIQPQQDIDEVGDAPMIIAEKATMIETMSVVEAVMKMDFLGLPSLLFINSGNKHINLVYYRKDNNISWLDTNISVWWTIY